jgi:hypothetical protein
VQNIPFNDDFLVAKSSFMYKILSISIFIIFAAIGIELIVPDANGIKVPYEFSEKMEWVEKIKYKNLIRSSLNGNLDALQDLIKAWCGGGSLCYQHGEVLVQIVDRIGEEKFIKILPKMSIEERSDLKSLLLAGLEYGQFEGDKRSRVFEKRFSKLSKALANL